MKRAARTLVALCEIVRPGNVLITAFSVIVGAMSAYTPIGYPLLVAMASAALISAGGYVINDVFDIEIDRINRPDRPIPRGDVTPIVATLWAATLLVSGVALSYLLGWPERAIAFGAAAGLVAYAAILKRTPLVGNLVVAAISGLTFLYGGLGGTHPLMSLAPAMLAGGYHLGRELLKVVADEEGDTAGGATTASVAFGPTVTARLAAIALVAVIPASLAPFVWGWFGGRYLITVMVGVDPVLGYVAWRAIRVPDRSEAAQLAVLLKWDMLVGLLAIGWDRGLPWGLTGQL